MPNNNINSIASNSATYANSTTYANPIYPSTTSSNTPLTTTGTINDVINASTTNVPIGDIDVGYRILREGLPRIPFSIYREEISRGSRGMGRAYDGLTESSFRRMVARLNDTSIPVSLVSDSIPLSNTETPTLDATAGIAFSQEIDEWGYGIGVPQPFQPFSFTENMAEDNLDNLTDNITIELENKKLSSLLSGVLDLAEKEGLDVDTLIEKYYELIEENKSLTQENVSLKIRNNSLN